jgi:hypothetical protein
MRIKIGLLMLSSTMTASNVAGRADTYNFIIIAAATPTTRGATFDTSGTLTGKPYPRIPSAIDLTDEALLYLDSSVGISPTQVYDNDGYYIGAFDTHASVDITPVTIGSFRLTPMAIPEPSSLMLLGIGILSLAAIARRRFRRL